MIPFVLLLSSQVYIHNLSLNSFYESFPDSWEAMVAVMGIKSFSPAARRLATSLCFIAYIMVRQIISDKTWPREGYELRFSIFLMQMLKFAVVLLP